MRWLWQDLHLSAGAFSAVYALQLASAVPSLVAARCGALFVGRGGAEVQSTGSIARCFHDPPLVERCGRLSKRPSLSPPDDGTGGSEARVYGFASGRSGVLILANSGSGTPPPVAFVRKIPSPTILAWECQQISPTLASEAKRGCGRGRRSTQTTGTAARLSAAALLDRLAYRSWGVCWALSAA